MPVIDAPNDQYGTLIEEVNIPVSVYFLDDVIIGQGENTLAPINQSGVVLSMIYCPFLEEIDLNLEKIPYDISYYGNPGGVNPYVYRVRSIINNTPDNRLVKKLTKNKISLFPPMQKQPTRKDWGNESKLYQYPYFYIDITDYINSPLTIKSVLMNNIAKDFDVFVRQTISLNGGYCIYVPDYKGDKLGQSEGIMSQGSLELPTSSSQYSQWLANNKSQFMTANQIANRNYEFSNYRNKLNATSSLIGGGLSQLGSLNVLGALGTGIQSGLNYDTTKKQNRLDRQNFIDNQMAMISDKKNSPRNVNLCGGDILNSIDTSGRIVDAVFYSITDHYKNKLCDYFTLYGYKQNKIMYEPNNGLYKSRKYFNYIKTMDANIHSINDMDKEEIEELKEIFNNGITWWHWFECNREQIQMNEVNHYDNREVY